MSGLAAFLGFICAYMACYMLHEWGHLAGAKLTGSHMPILSPKGVLIGAFDLAKHSREQFLGLSWGGVLGYLLVASICWLVWFMGSLGWFGAGLAVGGLAFVVQSLAVDMPQIVKVWRGADMVATSKDGANGAIIVKRTWQTWIPLAAVIVGLNVLGR